MERCEEVRVSHYYQHGCANISALAWDRNLGLLEYMYILYNEVHVFCRQVSAHQVHYVSHTVPVSLQDVSCRQVSVHQVHYVSHTVPFANA